MMAAAQPFLSGAISKTINMPNEATVEDVAGRLRAALAARSQGHRALPRRLQAEPAALDESDELGRREPTSDEASSRPRSPRPSLPLARADASEQQDRAARRSSKRSAGIRAERPASVAASRRKRDGFTQEARVGGHKVYLRTGEYEDGTLGEIFIDMHKEGAAFRSMMNCFAIAVSGPPVRRAARGVRRAVHVHALRAAGHGQRPPQHQDGDVDHRLRLPRARARVPRSHRPRPGPTEQLEDDEADGAGDATVDFGNWNAPERVRRTSTGRPRPIGAAPKGATPGVATPVAPKSHANGHSNGHGGSVNGLRVQTSAPTASAATAVLMPANALDAQRLRMMRDAPFCDVCGHITVRNGACYKCLNCGNSLGCS